MEVFHPHDALKPLGAEVSGLRWANLHSIEVGKVSGWPLQEKRYDPSAIMWSCQVVFS